MIFRYIPLLLLLLVPSSWGSGREPAVEDFVGVEVDSSKSTQPTDGVLFNLEQDMQKITESSNVQFSSQKNLKESTSWQHIVIGLIAGIGMPVILWFMMISRLKKKILTTDDSNLTLLEKYREEKKTKEEAEKRKAS